MKIELDSRFQKRVKGIFQRYSFEVGVLKDAPHKSPKRGQRGLGGKDVIGQYAGGPVRKKSSKDSGVSIAEVSEENRKRLRVNYLTAPFKNRSSAIIQFSQRFFQVVTGRGTPQRLVNMLQAIVRNPILAGAYGRNSAFTRKVKGFDRNMIDTAQLFKGITARVVKRV